jgi:sporulation protein YlmC with PRC-barrel domain
VPSPGDLHFGAAVHAAGGRRVGTLHRVIVDDDLSTLRDLVISESRRLSGSILSPGTPVLVNDVVVPMELVETVSRARIDLRISPEEVRALPPYVHWRYEEPSTGQRRVSTVSLVLGAMGSPSAAQSFAKSRTSLQIEGGEQVMLGRMGERLGTVRDLLFEGDALVAIVVHPAGFFRQDVLLPLRVLDRSDDMALFTILTRDDVEHLTPFHPDDD